MAEAGAVRQAAVGTVEVCYSGPDGVEIVSLDARPGWTIREAIEASGMLARHAIDLETNRVGIFGTLKDLSAPVRAGDRVEIYRPLTVDPNTARLRRAETSRNRKAK